MINNDSIVTAYDEHLTLVEWLQKVEKALDNAVLTNLGIAKLSDQDNIATYQVTATFADNTTIVSNPFTLPSTDIVTAFGNLTALVNGFNDRITNNEGDIGDINNKMLELPNTQPSTRKVVTIDTNGAQDNVDSTSLTTLMSNIVDSNGNARFVEFAGIASSIEGVTITYNKASLSGSHLMIVLAGSIANGITIKNAQTIARYNLPAYIMNKIIPVWANNIELKDIPAFADDWTSQSLRFVLGKDTNAQLYIFKLGELALTADRNFRIQFDLLIDSE